MAGIATGLAINPALPSAWREGQEPHSQLHPVRWKNKLLAALATMAVVKYQLRQISRGHSPNLAVSPVRALVLDQFMTARRTKRYRRWVAAR